MKKFWFYLNIYVYVNIKDYSAILYNTNTGDYIKITQKKVIDLIIEISNLDNLGSILIEEKILYDKSIKCVIDEIVDKDMGNLSVYINEENKPIILHPILKINKDVDKLLEKDGTELYLKKDINKYLLNLNIYLNDCCDKGCVGCDNYYLQFNCCTKNNKSNYEISPDNIKNIFNQIENFPFNIVNFLGGDIYKYKFLDSINEIKTRKEIHFYVNYKNYRKHKVVDNMNLDIIIDLPIVEELFISVINNIDKNKTKFHFIVTNDTEVEEAHNYINSFSIEKYIMHPFYTKENKTFFLDNVFINENDLQSYKCTMREIFRNQKINVNFFGNLYILPDGNIKSNMNTNVLANISDTSIIDVIYKELTENTSWRNIRTFSPCDECLFQFICPPISNYEYSFECKSLCHITNENKKFS